MCSTDLDKAVGCPCGSPPFLPAVVSDTDASSHTAGTRWQAPVGAAAGHRPLLVCSCIDALLARRAPACSSAVRSYRDALSGSERRRVVLQASPLSADNILERPNV